jgi:hypothetical protein
MSLIYCIYDCTSLLNLAVLPNTRNGKIQRGAKAVQSRSQNQFRIEANSSSGMEFAVDSGERRPGPGRTTVLVG